MKNLSLYNNDLSVPRKSDVDAKQDKVLVDGILQGDGQGAISAADTTEVELVELTKTDVGLGNVDNTSDANKPISTATQTALNGKQATITGGASTITSSNLTANRALISNASGKVAVSAVTSTELGYLDGVTSNIQKQLNKKLSSAGGTMIGDLTVDGNLTASGSIGINAGGLLGSGDDLMIAVASGTLITLTSDGVIIGNEGNTTRIMGVVDPYANTDAANKKYVDDTAAAVLPTVTTTNNGQFLRVVNGAWAVATVDNANGVSF